LDKNEGSIQTRHALVLRIKDAGKKGAFAMMIIGCDFHPSWQQVSWLDTETGDCGERKLVHASGDAQQFYQRLSAPVLIGMEATGNSQWFVEMVEDLGHAIWVGDAAQIRASYVRKQKTDKRDAAHILKLLLENRFPRLWTASSATCGSWCCIGTSWWRYAAG
jgi:transposase